MNNRTKAEKLAARPYVIETQPSETTENEPSCVAYVMELDGCMGQGKTKEEAISDVKLAMVDFIETLLDYDQPVPEPNRPHTVTVAAANIIILTDRDVDERPTTRRVAQFAFSATGS